MYLHSQLEILTSFCSNHHAKNQQDNCYQHQHYGSCASSMSFNANQIRNNPFFIYKKASSSPKASGFNVFAQCAYRRWSYLTEEEKMSYICPALQSFVIKMLRSHIVLPPGFDDVNNDPFDIAPFMAADFRLYMRKVVSSVWRHLDNETREAWNYCAAALNDKPVVGLFC